MALQVWISVCLTLLFMLSQASSATGRSDPGDVQNLNAVKSKWQNTPPTWKGSDPCGDSWHGLRCNDSSRVVSLSLSSMNLSGTLATEIGSLTGLTILDLSYNKLLTGSIPTTLGNLINLRSLVLIGCGFTGNIPPELGNLLALAFLDLSSNSLNGPIPPSVGNLTELFLLDLANNQLSGSLPVSSLNGSGLDRLIKAQHFHLNQNQFGGPIPQDIFHADMQLIHVLLDSNCLVGKIPSTLGDVQTLEVIRLDGNFLEGPIPSNIGKLENLSELHLSNNKLNGALPDVSGLNRLQYIDLSNNSFDASSEALKFFITLEQLTTLIIENGHLTGSVPPALFRLPQLETIKLANNDLNGTLRIGINISPRLQLIDVENNQITKLVWAENTNNPTFFCRLKGNPALEKLSLLAKANSCLAQFRNPNDQNYSTRSCENPKKRGIEGELVFRSPSFSDIRNKSRLELLKNSLSTQLNLSEKAVSICSISFDANSYLKIMVKLFPLGKRQVFDRSDILNIGSALSQKSYIPPSEFGTFYFVVINAYFIDPIKSKRLRRNAIYGIAFGALSLSIMIAGVAVYAIIQKRRADKARMISKPFASWRGTGPEGAPKINVVRSFTFQELEKCTHHFSEAYKIGSGGYGTVYKGILSGGNEMVAIKRAKTGSMQGAAEFKNEIELLSRVHHKNLVTLIGFYFDEGEQMLVYEYMPNGSLSQNLYGQRGTYLDWRKRIRIAVGAARGLTYLHEHANPPIIHRDVKSSNILLDQNLNAKVADFGLSKLAVYAEEDNNVSTKLKGTLGYMDPEYYLTLQLSEKSDVYSLGVVLLEILTGKQAIEGGQNIVKWVEDILEQEKGDVRALIDPTLGVGSCADVRSFKSFLKVALLCVEEWGINRPSTNAVVKELESILNDVEETASLEQLKTSIGKAI